MELSNCRIHKGKLVRMFKGACGGKNEIFCSTPDCINNCVEESKCGLPLVNVVGANCNDYVPKKEQTVTVASTASRKVTIKRTAAEKEDEKDITIEVPESNAKDIKSPADKDKGNAEEKEVQEVKDTASIKSELWTTTLNKTIEEALDVESAADAWMKNMKKSLGEKLADEEISEADYDSLLDELEDMHENGILEDAIKDKINESAGDIDGGAEEPPLEEAPKDEKTKEEEPKKEEEKPTEKKEEAKPKKKTKEELPELPGLDLENV